MDDCENYELSLNANLIMFENSYKELMRIKPTSKENKEKIEKKIKLIDQLIPSTNKAELFWSSYPNWPLSFLPTEYTTPFVDKNKVNPSPQEIVFIFEISIGIGDNAVNKLVIFFNAFEIVLFEVDEIILKLLWFVFLEDDSSVLNKYFEFFPFANW